MKKSVIFIMMCLLNSVLLFSQVAINTDGSAPANSAMLDVKSASKGLLPPRMTFTELSAISGPENGLIVYCTDCGPSGLGALAMFMAGSWYALNANCLAPLPTSQGSHVPSATQIIWNWNAVTNAAGYKWNDVNDSLTAEDMGTNTSKTETGLVCLTPYTRYVWVYSSCGLSASTTLNQSTSGTSMDAPSAGIHEPSLTQIIWHWNTVEGAADYKFGLTDDYESAIDVGTDLSYTETGLDCNTAYTRYVWAHSGCGLSSPTLLTQSTSVCAWACGDSLTVGHVEGSVAPVSKAVTYGTVINIPGEPAKCWITSNLGADHQANAPDDNTEASAGWYWQFNRQQGYKHDGTTRTPNTTWIGTIDENSDWLHENDPCSLLLGAGWRFPTSTEWANVDAVGGWNYSIDAWNSDLRIHKAGYLNAGNSSLEGRGNTGRYWTSSQHTNTLGRIFQSYSENTSIQFMSKAAGHNARCLKENIPQAPAAVAHFPYQDQIIWNWNNVEEGRGFKWNTVNDYASASDIGTDTSLTETGLTCNTLYTRYFWAYNYAGHSEPSTFTQSTYSCSWSCGDPLTINHVAGNLAPVNKTVTYNTVDDIPGETSKCWITSNLGADHQANTVNDNTEPSAGWYWQFNALQGYKHDGTTLTPSWNTGYSWTGYDWLPINDPCNIVFGNGWRIPTLTEWSNVDAAGNWTNWMGPWNSALKMHAAGYLSYGGGELVDNGLVGYYYSSTSMETALAAYMIFSPGGCLFASWYKTHATPVRCIRD